MCSTSMPTTSVPGANALQNGLFWILDPIESDEELVRQLVSSAPVSSVTLVVMRRSRRPLSSSSSSSPLPSHDQVAFSLHLCLSSLIDYVVTSSSMSEALGSAPNTMPIDGTVRWCISRARCLDRKRRRMGVEAVLRHVVAGMGMGIAPDATATATAGHDPACAFQQADSLQNALASSQSGAGKQVFSACSAWLNTSVLVSAPEMARALADLMPSLAAHHEAFFFHTISNFTVKTVTLPDKSDGGCGKFSPLPLRVEVATCRASDAMVPAAIPGEPLGPVPIA